jgi:NAD(P)-dependent dehydrogenase (short-subunit alcohol dehydrogenase family)
VELLGKVAIVTGATRGIGRATALLFAREGASVTVAGRTEDRGRSVVEEIRAAGGRAVFVPTDVSRAADVTRMVAVTIEEFGGIDCLVNNAGIEEEWDVLIDINLKGHFLCAVAVVPGMLERGGGAIVNTSSVLATATMLNSGVYSASKGGVISLTRAMAL